LIRNGCLRLLTTNNEYSLLRNDKYCADEQTCIKEGSNGECEAFGYCTEERRTWNFGGESCEPVFNTCKTFTRVFGEKEGESMSLLENTLNYGDCDEDNAGCRAYCENYDYLAKKFTCTLTGAHSNTNNKLFLDYGADEFAQCDASEEGCHEFIRPKKDKGVNLITNSSFEDNLTGNWGNIPIIDDDVFVGDSAVAMSGNISRTIILGPNDYQANNEILNLSIYSKDCGDDDEFELAFGPNDRVTSSLNTSDNWERASLFIVAPSNYTENTVDINIRSTNCHIDAVQLERGERPSTYGDYRERGLVYEKVVPSYLDCTSGSNAEECSKFVRECTNDDLGCELYTSESDDITLPAKTTIRDLCPEECVGYDDFLQLETPFDSLQNKYFIPKISGKCSVGAAGCDEFTNLDKIGEGAEAREYYSSLKRCIKPNENECDEFYLWEGSSDTGYQLKVFSLKVDDDANDPPPPAISYVDDPAVIEDDYTECSKEIYNLSATDPAHNDDCREFYNRDGGISYHLYSRVISCAENCHPYRRSLGNKISHDVCQSECLKDSNCEDHCDDIDCDNPSSDGLSTCRVDDEDSIFCKSSGIWNYSQKSCIYMAIPGEGRVCSSANAGCREYSGNAGSNEQIILNSDFEQGTNGSWSGNLSPSPENDSLFPGKSSLYVNSDPYVARITLGTRLRKNKSYILSFLAKKHEVNGANNFNEIRINSGSAYVNFEPLAPVSVIGDEWELYNFNISILNNDSDEFKVDDTAELYMEMDGEIYLDNVRLTMITDRYFLKRDELNVPETCLYDVYGNFKGDVYNLGCDSYTDRDGDLYHFHSFDKFCDDSVVGCELMIDTHNYSDYRAETWNFGGNPDDEGVGIDSYVYMVYDQDKLCNEADQGCQLLGYPGKYGSDVLYKKTYYTNNPDKYDEILCDHAHEDCDVWSTDEGQSFFKDPGYNLCEWKQETGVGLGGWGWFKRKMKFCDISGDGSINNSSETNICFNASDCSKTGISCDDGVCADNNVCVDGECHYACVFNDVYDVCDINNSGTLKTVGLSNQWIEQPINFWAGLCPASQSGCTEYIDPVSSFSTNLVFNGDFSQDVDGDGNPDGWGFGPYTQPINLEPYTLYIFSSDSQVATLDINVFVLGDDNSWTFENLGSVGNSWVNSKIFFTGSNAISQFLGMTTFGGKVEIKKAIIDYELKDKLSEGDCNGQADFGNGCVYFNERSVIDNDNNGYNYSIRRY